MKRLRPEISILTICILLSLLLQGCSATAAAIIPDDSRTTGSADSESSSSPTDSVPSEDSSLTVHFLDVGQGDCTLITQGNHAMLIDAGDNSKGTAVQLYLQNQEIDTLDYVVLTHPDADHIGGADVVLYKFDCRTVLMPDISNDTRTYEDVLQTMEYRNYHATYPRVGDTYELGTASFTILSPDCIYNDSNNNSLVIRLTHGNNTFLFTGDAEQAAETHMLASGLSLEADVLKVGHHGSSSSTGEDFLAAVDPDYAVISCGKDNDYGHPHAETLDRLNQAGITIFRTDEQGTILAVSDGQEIRWDVDSSADQDSVSEPPIYILNTRSMKIHLPNCESVSDMSENNKKESRESKEDLIAQGYEPCGRCNP